VNELQICSKQYGNIIITHFENLWTLQYSHMWWLVNPVNHLVKERLVDLLKCHLYSQLVLFYSKAEKEQLGRKNKTIQSSTRLASV